MIQTFDHLHIKNSDFLYKIIYKMCMAESKFIKIKSFWKAIGLDHTSPSQFNNPLCKWLWNYVKLSAKERKAIPPSVSMEMGGIVGQAVQDMKTKKLTVNEVYGDK